MKDSQGYAVRYEGTTTEQLAHEVKMLQQRIAELELSQTQFMEAEEALQRSEAIEERRLAEENELLARIGQIISSSLDVDDVYEQFAEEVRNLVPIDRIAITVYDPERGAWNLAYVWGLESKEFLPGSLISAAHSVTAEVVRTRSRFIFVGEDKDKVEALMPRMIPLFNVGLRTFLWVPLISKDEVIGVLTLASTDTNAYSNGVLDLVERVGTQISGAIANSQLYAQIKRTEEELKRSNSELEQFAYVASHDLQEPLRMVTSYVQILSEDYKGKLSDDADRFIGYIVGGATRMRTLIDALLTLSRIGNQGRAFEPTDCNDVLQRVIANLEATIDNSGAVVTQDVLPIVNGDAVQLTQLFQNLVSNGIKFRSTEAPYVHVSAEKTNHEWVFSVRDNGIGIAPRHHQRIFLMFQRLHSRSEYSGTGIGLALCQKIVQRHGGRIWLDSGEDKGSTFYFTVPGVSDKEVAYHGNP